MKTLVKVFFRLLFVSAGLFIFSESKTFAQNQPNLLDLRTCGKSCSSNNFTIKEVYLSNASGVPLANSFATCTPGVQQTAFISFVYSSNSGSSTDNTRLFADLVIGGSSQYINVWLGNLPAAKSGDRVVTLNYQFTWTCGLEVSLRNPLMAWTTSGSANLSNSYQCNDYPSAQCQFGSDIIVNAPLAVQFAYTACTENGNSIVNFTSTSNGGKKPYTFRWNFGTNASPTTSNVANPSVTYSSNGTATLVLTDANGVSNTFTRNIVLPSEITYSSTVSQPTPGNSNGSIMLTLTGGTGNKTITWNDGGSGTTRNNLGPGTYVATIRDEFNCQKTATFVLSSPIPRVSLVKSGAYEDFNNDGIQNAGDRINYTFVIGNTGNFPLTNVFISDPSINLNGSPISLGVSETNTTAFSGFHTIVQNDLELGFFTNTATVSATAGSIVLTNTSSHTENFTISPRISVQKIQSGGPNPVTNPNQEIEYRISVSNVGNVNISNVSVRDFLPGTSTPVILNVESGDVSDPGILNVGEEWIFSLIYPVTQSVFDLGESIVNVVNVTSTQVPGPVVASARTPITQNPALSIDKSVAESSFDAVGDVLNYTVTVTNTGNVTLSNVVVVDPLTGLNQTISSLAPTASQSFNTSYTIVQSDLDNGSVANTASASSGSVNISDQVTVNAVQSPALGIQKTAAEGSYDAVGDLLNYTIVVTNTGNVTLSNVVVVDPLTGLNQTIASLAPTASQSFNTSYAVTQADIDARSVANTASASSGSVSVSDQVTVNAVQSPALSIDKSVAESSFDAVGDVLNYTVVVTNTGNVTLSNVVVVDPLTGLNQTISSLAPTASQSFNTSYTIVQSDLDNGSVGNTASASSSSVSVSDQVIVNATQNPALSIDKSVAESSFDAVGDVLNYTVTVTNTGNVTLSNVVVVDPLTGLNQTIPSLAPTASQSFNTSYTIVQSDLDNGSVSNTASASSGSVSVSDQVVVDAVQSPALSVQKTAAEGSFNAVGDVLNYTIVVTNTGNVTLSNVVVVDPLTGLNQTIPSLAPTASQTFNTSYTIVQSDLDNGSVANTASATSGSVSVSDQVIVDAVQSPALIVQKTAAEGSFDAVGDVLNYTIVVTNTGNVTLSNVVVVDPLTGLNQTIASLAPTASQSFNTSYTIVQSDIDAGSVANTASASSGSVSVSDQVTVNAAQSPALSIQKTVAEGSYDGVGDVLNYTVVVTNTGNVTLSNVVVVDPLTGLNQTIASLAPTASQSFNTSYAVTQADIDARSVANTASASSGSVSVSDQVTVNAVQSPALSIQKTVAEGSYDAVGDVLNYTIVVNNTGNVTLSNVVVVDPLTGLNQNIASLAPTASQSFNTSYTIVQSDLDNGSVANTASASSGSVSVSDQVTVNAVQSPALSIQKTAAEGSYDAVGDVLNYTIVVTNTGNVTLSNVVVVDPLTGLNQNIASLAPTASQSFNTSYTIVQSDLDNGSVANTASASSGSVSVSDQVVVDAVQSPALSIQKTVAEGSFDAVGDVLNYTIVVTNTGNVTLSNVVVVDPLTGLNQNIASLAPTASQSFNTSYTIVQSDLDNGSVGNTANASSGSVSVSDQVVVNAVQSPALSIQKTAAEGSFDAVGDVLNYTIVVTNTGNVALSNVVVIDPLTGLNQTIASLAPTASQSFNTSYMVVQSDIDNGSVGNTASASSGSVSVSDQVTVNAVQSPALGIQKTAAEGSYDAVGDVLNYTIVVTNTGNVALSNVVVIDPLTGLNQTIASLAPTASQSFNTSYTIVQSDLDNGSVGNTASASSGSVSVSDQVTVNAVQSPALSIQKTVAEGSFDAVGDVLNYTIVVTNTGNVTLSNVVVVDPLTGLNQTISSLAPTASQNFNTSYTIVQSDLDNGSLANTASTTSGPVSVSDQVVVNAVQSPALSIDKSVAESSFDAVGDVLNYTVTVTNTGNVTLSNVVVVDPLTGLNQTIASLAPTASQSFNTAYTIVQSDLDNGSVANTASASSGQVSVSDQVVVNAVQNPALSIQKTVAEGSYDAVGDVLNYTVVVTNTGNVTLSNVVVVDPLTGLNQTIASLAPTASQSFNTSYTIVQSDLDNGSVGNTASASSSAVSVSDQVTVNAVQLPALSIDKSVAESSFDAVGDVLNYTIVVTNTGNTTLSNVVVVDPLTGLNQTISSLAPTASQSFNTSYTIVQSDLDNGSVANSASVSSGSVSVSDQVIVNATQNPALSIDKSVAESSFDAVGDVLNYTVTVTNTGNVTLSNVVVVDPLTGLNQTIPSLAPTASQSFNTSYTIVQSDLDNGSVANTASASSGSVSVSDQVVVNAVQNPALSIQKIAAEGSFDAVGDVLNYTIIVTNTGNVTLSNVVVVDPLTGLNQTISSLAPTASQSFNTSYTIVQSDLDNGLVSNTASASSGSVSVSDHVVVNAVQSPALGIQKTAAEGSYDAVGDVLNYTVVVTNTGNVTLSNVVVVDPLTGLNQTIPSLAPTASQSFNTSYTIVQSDLDNGSVANSASVSSGSVSVSDQVIVNATQNPALSIDKSVAESSFDAVGDVLNYTIVVTNAGNTTLSNVVVVDPLTGLNQTIPSLAPTASESFNNSYTIVQSDLDNGSVANTASASSGSLSVSDQVVVDAVQNLALSIQKTAAEGSYDAVGDVLNYTIVVTNTGNVTLSNVVVVDPLTGLNQTIASLAPTASQSFNTSYTIVQSDLDNGSVGNTASTTSGPVSVSDQVTVNAVQSPALGIQKTVAEGSFDAVGDVLNYAIVVTNTGNVTLSNVVVVDPLTGLNQTIASLAPTASQTLNTSYTIVQSDLDNGSVANTASASSGSVSVSDQVVVNAVQSPALGIQKTVAEGSYDSVGDVLNYTVVVTNTGNVTLSNVVVVDPLTGLNQTIASLAPTASQSFNTSYTIVQSDIDAGSVANTASASSGSVLVSDQVVVNAVQSPALGIQKTAAEGSYSAVGDVLNYTIVVTNTGNTTLSNVVVVDPLTGLNQTIASLAPTASQSFNTSYTIVQSDLNNGSVANTASASSGSVSISDQVVVNAVQSPALGIQKTAAEGSYDAVGDVLNYTIVVTNTGNVTLSNVVVVDPLTGLNQNIASLAPTASQSFNTSYTIVQSDIDAGSVANTASATSGSVSVSDQVTVNAVQSPALGIQKTVVEGSFDAVGDVLNYTIVVTNTGNVTLSNVLVVDPLTSLNQTIPSLAPTASQSFNTSYSVIQTDIDHGSVGNTASASSGSVSVSDQVTVNAVQSPALSIQKTAAEGSYDALGDVLNYTVTVTNTGNVTLSNVVVVDPLTGLNQTIASLAPTASQSFNTSYTIVQSDLDNGSVANTASASSGSVSVSDQVVVNAIQSPALGIQKTVAEGSYDAVGDLLNYTIVVTNTGNVTLSNVVVVDPLTGLNQTIPSLAPTASQTFNTSYTIVQSDLDNGSVGNTASATSGSVSVSDQVVVDAVQSPALIVQKTAAEGSFDAVGDVLNYTIVVTNTGNVTLSNVVVVDPLTGLNQTIASLAPTASQSFNTSYVVTQADIDNGSVGNTASASSGSVSVSDQVIVNAVQSPALSIQKTVAEGSYDAVGDVLNYTVTVTNTGNTTLSNVVVVDPLTGLNQTIPSLAPTASQSFNTSYTIVQSDLDNGSVANTASASSGSVSVSDQVTVNAVQNPALSIDKSLAESTYDAVGDVLNYTVTVTNTGNTTLSNVVVVDPLTGLNQTIPSLAPTASQTFNTSYTIVQSDLDNGSVANTASASSGSVSVSDQVVVNAVQNPALSIQKTAAEGSFDALGDVLNYTVVVTNTGNTTLSNVVVVDPLTGLNRTIPSLAPTASQTFNTSYTIVQSDLDNGSVGNTASASSGSVSVSDQVVVNAVQSPALSIQKTAAEGSYDAVGDVLNYTVVVTNTGNVTLSNVVVVDPLTGLNQTISSLAPTASQSFNTSYTIVQSDLDNGSVANTASASSGSVSVSDQVIVNAVQNPALSIQKTAAEGSFDAVGDVLNYTIIVTNTGNVTLSNVVVVDPLTGLNQTIPSLAPTASQSFNTSYTIVQSDLDNGSVGNTASASSGSVSVSDQVTVNAVQSPALGIQKTVAEGSYSAVGDVLNYTIVVTNTGNVTLSNVVVVDPLTGLNQTIPSLAPTASQSFNTSYTIVQSDLDNGSVANTASASSGSVSVSDQVTVNAVQSPALSIDKSVAESSFDAVGDVLNYTIVVTNTGNVTLSNVVVVDPLTGLNQTIASLAPTASQSFNTSYTIDQSDLDNGSLANTASATSGPVSVSDQVVVNAVQSPALSIQKTVAEGSFDAVGDVLNYTIVVTNTGNTTLSNVVVVDPLTGLNQTIASLAPTASQSFNTSYVVTQADIDNGSVANTASASSGSVSVSDQVVVDALQSPALSIQKTVAEGSYDAVGDVLNYIIVVTNSGNVTLSNVVVVDPLTGLNQTIPSLAPTASQSFNTSYVVTQADIDNGSVGNKASASSGSVSVSDQVTVNAVQSPALSIDKSVAESSFDAVGDVLNYTVTVTNTGNTTLSNVVVVDPLTGLNQTIPSLAPTASQSFNTSYVVTQADIDNGSVGNTASASSGSVSVSDQVVVNAVQSPALSIQKTVAEGSYDAVGDVLNYTVVVTNTGNVTLSNVVVVDPLTGLNQTIASLAPTASQSFNTSYTIVQSDLDNGSVANTASASSGSVSVSDQVVVNAVQSPALSIQKTVAEGSYDSVGDVLNYTVTVTNTGNVTLSNVVVVDPLTGLNQTIGTLAPGTSQSFNTSYTIVQSDLDNGSVANTASASSGSVSVSDQVVVNAVQSPALGIQKTAAEGSYDAVGDVLNYTIVVTNTGNLTLSNVVVVDPLTGLNQNIASLAPTASQSFNTSYTIVQSDLDNGSVANTASASSGSVSVSDQVTVNAVQSPALDIQKTAAEGSFDAVGDVLNYTIVVTNTGNVTLSNVVVVDPLTGLNQTIASLAPTASQNFNTSYVVTQADLDKGEILNIATASTLTIAVKDEVLTIANSMPAIEVTKTADLTSFSQIGQTITYTIIVKNVGNVTLGNVIVSDPLTGFEDIIENLAPGQSVTFQTKYEVTAADLEKGSIVNVVNAFSKSPKDDQIDGSDSVTVGSTFTPIIAVDDDLGEYPVDFGGVLGNILGNDLLNNKPVDWKDVNFEFSELAGVVGLLINENGELSLVPGLNPPGEYVLKYVLREALNPANQDEATVTFKLLVNDVDLAVSKTSKGVEIFEGDEFDYEILVENVGETDASNVLVVDELPSQVTYLSSSFEPSLPNLSAKVSVSGSKVTYTIDQLPAKSSILIRMRVRANAIDSDKAQSITNVARVSSEEDDLNPSDNQDTDVNQINPFFIPNVITPSGNGMNDKFEIKGINKFVSTEIVIFNRNGDHVYEMKNYQNDWTAEGLVAGTYFYVLKATDRQGKEHEYKGWIQVIK